MKPGSPQQYSSRTCATGGFTLLELTIAMMFVVLLAGGITLTISTSLNVWRRSQEAGDLNQEARAVMELLARDVRGAYLGVDKNVGYFFGMPAAEGQRASDTLELCTGSSALVRAALAPDENRDQWGEQIRPPLTDYVAVRYEFLASTASGREGLYRTTWAVPIFEWALEEGPPDTPMNIELVSEAATDLRFEYFDGEEWVDYWETTEESIELPQAVGIELTLLDARDNEHVYRTTVSIPAA